MTLTTIDEVTKTGIAIELVRGIIDKASPEGQDLSPEYDYAMRAPLYNLAHSGIENGLKALIRQVEGDHPGGHNLKNLLRKLKGKAPQKAKFLEEAFNDIVNFYTIDTVKWAQFQSLDTYLKEFGSEDLFETYRYWALEKKDLYHIPLFIHRELLVVLEKLCRWGIEQITSQRVEYSIRYSFVRGVEEHINNCDDCRKDSSKPWLKILNKSFPSATPFSERLRGVNSQDFEIVDDECLNQVICTALEHLATSDDPAVRYFIHTLNDLPEGSVPQLCDVQLEVDESGIVKIRNGDQLGFIHQNIDSRWYAQDFFHKYNPQYAKTKDDAMNWLANECTEIVKVSVNGGPHIPKRTMSRPSPLYPDWNDSRLGYKMTFLNDDQRLSVGQHLEVRSGPHYYAVDDGIISEISGREVTWEDTSFTLKSI